MEVVGQGTCAHCDILGKITALAWQMPVDQHSYSWPRVFLLRKLSKSVLSYAAITRTNDSLKWSMNNVSFSISNLHVFEKNLQQYIWNTRKKFIRTSHENHHSYRIHHSTIALTVSYALSAAFDNDSPISVIGLIQGFQEYGKKAFPFYYVFRCRCCWYIHIAAASAFHNFIFNLDSTFGPQQCCCKKNMCNDPAEATGAGSLGDEVRLVLSMRWCAKLHGRNMRKVQTANWSLLYHVQRKQKLKVVFETS